MLSPLLLFFARYGLLLILALNLANVKRELKATPLAIALAYGLNLLIRAFVYVPRPFVALEFEPAIAHAVTSSFPSGHAVAGFALAFSTFATRPALGALSLTIAVLMSAGRVLAGLHWPADVVAGLVIGALFAYLASLPRTTALLSSLWKRIRG